MKCNSIATSSFWVLSLLFAATAGHAQSAAQASVPFAFKVGTAQVPAGTYTITKEMDTIISIRNVKTDATVLAMGTRQSSTKAERLIFRHVGSQYFLTEICGAKGTLGMVFPAPRRNAELQVATVPRNAGKTVEIALR